MKLYEIMKQCEGLRVAIKRPVREGLVKVEYEGRLGSVPAWIALQEVADSQDLEDGSSVIWLQKRGSIDRDSLIREIIEGCQRDPALARKIVDYLRASDFGRELMEGHILAEVLGE